MCENKPLGLYPSGYVVYHFDMHVACDTEIPCCVSHPRVREIIFKKVNPDDKVDSKWSVTIYTNKVASVDEVDQIGDDIRESLFDVISVTLDTKIYGLRFVGHNVAPRQGEGAIINITLPGIVGNIHMVSEGMPLKPEQINDIKNNIESISFTNLNSYYGLYRYAKSVDEPLVQFMILYLIMYEMFKNSGGRSSQKQVDEHIMIIAPTTPQESIPLGSPRCGERETIYSKLRNQLTHYRDVPPEITRREIINCLDAFRKIVLTAVRNFVP